VPVAPVRDAVQDRPSDTVPIRVLIAAGWYPAHDDTNRGRFVADLAAALKMATTDVIVASWEIGIARERNGRYAPTAAEWWGSIADRTPIIAPRSWGAPGVPVARLPVAWPTVANVEREPLSLAELQAATLVPFGSALDRSWPISLIHAHNGIPDGLAAARLASRLGVPLVVSEHDSRTADRLLDPRLRTAYLSLLASGRVIAVSPSQRDRLATVLGVPAERMGIVPNPVDLDAFVLAADGSRRPEELLWVGTRKASKGIDTLLRAFARVHSERPDLRLRCIGSAANAEEGARVDALVSGLGIATALSLEPAADRPAVAAAMQRAAAFVHPSPYETFGLVAAEAIATGLPVAATPSGGVDDIVGSDGLCGMIAERDDDEALARSILAVMDGRAGFDPRRMRDRIRDRYGPPAVAASALDEYRRTMASRSSVATTPPLRASRTPRDRDGPFEPPLIVAFNRRRAIERLRTVPEPLLSSIDVVTSPGRTTDGPPPPNRFEADGDAPYRRAVVSAGGPLPPAATPGRLLRAALHPVRAIRLRRIAGRREEMVAAARNEAVAAILDERARRGRGRGTILALDADDVGVLEPLLRSGVELEPGGLRSIVDRWDSLGRPVPTLPGTTLVPD
jgi:teichuronic acid biosynthesis glycosyltransferase TuaC